MAPISGTIGRNTVSDSNGDGTKNGVSDGDGEQEEGRRALYDLKARQRVQMLFDVSVLARGGRAVFCSLSLCSAVLFGGSDKATPRQG